jgi:hypothetical protein
VIFFRITIRRGKRKDEKEIAIILILSLGAVILPPPSVLATVRKAKAEESD